MVAVSTSDVIRPAFFSVLLPAHPMCVPVCTVLLANLRIDL